MTLLPVSCLSGGFHKTETVASAGVDVKYSNVKTPKQKLTNNNTKQNLRGLTVL